MELERFDEWRHIEGFDEVWFPSRLLQEVQEWERFASDVSYTHIVHHSLSGCQALAGVAFVVKLAVEKSLNQKSSVEFFQDC